MPEPSTHHVRPGHHFRFRPGEAITVFSALDGFRPTANDEADFLSHQSQVEDSS